MTIAPVVRTVQVRTSPEESFELFVRHMGRWWSSGRTLAKNPHVEIVLEPRPEGRWYERDAEGHETHWGKVLVWNPPGQLILGWQITSDWVFDPNFLTEVEVTFVEAPGGGTIVTLEHRDMHRFGKDAERVAEQVGDGWPKRLADFRAYADQAAEASRN